jgi:hypothetical protein
MKKTKIDNNLIQKDFNQYSTDKKAIKEGIIE